MNVLPLRALALAMGAACLFASPLRAAPRTAADAPPALQAAPGQALAHTAAARSPSETTATACNGAPPATARCSLIANVAVTGGGANGIIRSGAYNHAIRQTDSGTSMNIVSGAFDDTGPVVHDWDFNFWSADDTLTLWKILSGHNGQYAVGSDGKALLLHVGDTVSAANTFTADSGTTELADAWLAGANGYIGVRFDCDGRLAFPVAGGVCYGYIHLSTGASSGFPATVIDTAFDGDGAAITIAADILVDPVAEVTPTAGFDFSVDQGASGSDTMAIRNIGGGTLTYSIAESAVRGLNPPSWKTAAAAKAKAGDAGRPAVLASARSLGGNGFGRPFVLQATDISQMADNSPGDEGVSCGVQSASTADNSWWRRFSFNDYPAVGASTSVQSVTISTGSSTISGGVPSTINLYTIAHSTAADTIPTSGLTLIGTANFIATGSLASITVPVTGAVNDTAGKDLVIEWHTDGNAAGGQFFPGANATAQTHSTFMSSSTCGITAPTASADLGFPDFHLTMVVSLDGGTGASACDAPGDLPWLSATPASGSLTSGASSDVVVTVDASTLAAGTHTANLCVTTNDPTHALVPVPVRVTVQPVITDGIFCNGFEMGGDGSCGRTPQPGDIVSSGPINVAIPQSMDGLYINFVTGQTSPTEIPGYDFDPYKGNNVLLFYWAGDVSVGTNGGVAATETGPYLVLGSGAVVGPSSTFSASADGTTNETVNFRAGVDGYLGVKFRNEATRQTNYGYVHIKTTSPSGFPATILDYAYDKTGAAITIP